MAEAICEEYKSSLVDLTFNSKPHINMLTMLAEENQVYAPQIVQVIENHLQKAKPSEKLPVIYLLDSIIKNIRSSDYPALFTQNIVSTFCAVFEKVDEKTRQQLFKLRQTWNDIFPQKKLYAIDVRVNQMDPAWPITALPPAQAIHINPKFLSKATEIEPLQSFKEKQETEMRQQLIAKQQELLRLQQQKLEMELIETKKKLEEQAKQLQTKEHESPSSSPPLPGTYSSPIYFNRSTHSPPQTTVTTFAQTIPSSSSIPIGNYRDPRLNSRDPRLRNLRVPVRVGMTPEPLQGNFPPTSISTSIISPIIPSSNIPPIISSSTMLPSTMPPSILPPPSMPLPSLPPSTMPPSSLPPSTVPPSTMPAFTMPPSTMPPSIVSSSTIPLPMIPPPIIQLPIIPPSIIPPPLIPPPIMPPFISSAPIIPPTISSSSSIPSVVDNKMLLKSSESIISIEQIPLPEGTNKKSVVEKSNTTMNRTLPQNSDIKKNVEESLKVSSEPPVVSDVKPVESKILPEKESISLKDNKSISKTLTKTIQQSDIKRDSKTSTKELKVNQPRKDDQDNKFDKRKPFRSMRESRFTRRNTNRERRFSKERLVKDERLDKDRFKNQLKDKRNSRERSLSSGSDESDFRRKKFRNNIYRKSSPENKKNRLSRKEIRSRSRSPVATKEDNRFKSRFRNDNRERRIEKRVDKNEIKMDDISKDIDERITLMKAKLRTMKRDLGENSNDNSPKENFGNDSLDHVSDAEGPTNKKVKTEESDVESLFASGKDRDYRQLAEFSNYEQIGFGRFPSRSPAQSKWAQFKANHPENFTISPSNDDSSPFGFGIKDQDMRVGLPTPDVDDVNKEEKLNKELTLTPRNYRNGNNFDMKENELDPRFSKNMRREIQNQIIVNRLSYNKLQQSRSMPQEIIVDSENHKTLTVKQQEEILRQAERQLLSGEMTHEQHQELLKQLHQLYQIQKLREMRERQKQKIIEDKERYLQHSTRLRKTVNRGSPFRDFQEYENEYENYMRNEEINMSNNRLRDMNRSFPIDQHKIENKSSLPLSNISLNDGRRLEENKSRGSCGEMSGGKIAAKDLQDSAGGLANNRRLHNEQSVNLRELRRNSPEIKNTWGVTHSEASNSVLGKPIGQSLDSHGGQRERLNEFRNLSGIMTETKEPKRELIKDVHIYEDEIKRPQVELREIHRHIEVRDPLGQSTIEINTHNQPSQKVQPTIGERISHGDILDLRNSHSGQLEENRRQFGGPLVDRKNQGGDSPLEMRNPSDTSLEIRGLQSDKQAEITSTQEESGKIRGQHGEFPMEMNIPPREMVSPRGDLLTEKCNIQNQPAEKTLEMRGHVNDEGRNNMDAKNSTQSLEMRKSPSKPQIELRNPSLERIEIGGSVMRESPIRPFVQPLPSIPIPRGNFNMEMSRFFGPQTLNLRGPHPELLRGPIPKIPEPPMESIRAPLTNTKTKLFPQTPTAIRTILIDNEPREIHFHDDVGFIINDGKPYNVNFQGPVRNVVINGISFPLVYGNSREVIVDGRSLRIKFGGPSRELIINGIPFDMRFGSPPVDIILNGIAYEIELPGPPPEVTISDQPRDDLIIEDYTHTSFDQRHLPPQPFSESKPIGFENSSLNSGSLNDIKPHQNEVLPDHNKGGNLNLGPSHNIGNSNQNINQGPDHSREVISKQNLNLGPDPNREGNSDQTLNIASDQNKVENPNRNLNLEPDHNKGGQPNQNIKLEPDFNRGGNSNLNIGPDHNVGNLNSNLTLGPDHNKGGNQNLNLNPDHNRGSNPNQNLNLGPDHNRGGNTNQNLNLGPDHNRGGNQNLNIGPDHNRGVILNQNLNLVPDHNRGNSNQNLNIRPHMPNCAPNMNFMQNSNMQLGPNPKMNININLTSRFNSGSALNVNPESNLPLNPGTNMGPSNMNIGPPTMMKTINIGNNNIVIDISRPPPSAPHNIFIHPHPGHPLARPPVMSHVPRNSSSMFPRIPLPPPVPQPIPAPAAPMNISELFEKLVKVGILKKSEPTNSLVASVIIKTDVPPSKEIEPEEDAFIPEINFTPDELKVHHHGVIKRLYSGIQCQSCGVRFTAENTDKYAQHLDWHFRMNRREKDGAKKAISRRWYYDMEGWIQFEEIEDLDDKARSSYFEMQAHEESSFVPNQTSELISCPVASGSDEENICAMCGEQFEPFWVEEEEAWHLKDALRVNKLTYHPVCYEDAKDQVSLAEADGSTSPVIYASSPSFEKKTKSKTIVETDSQVKGKIDIKDKAEARSKTDAKVKTDDKPKAGVHAKLNIQSKTDVQDKVIAPSKAEPQIKTGVQIKVEAQSKTDVQGKVNVPSKTELPIKAGIEIKIEVPSKTDIQDKVNIPSKTELPIKAGIQIKIEVPSKTDIQDKVNTDDQDKVNTDVQNKVNTDVQDKVNTDVQDKVNTDVQDKVKTEKVNTDVQDKVNTDVQDKVNTDVQDKVNTDVQDKVNTDVHDKVNTDVQDKVNTDVQDKVNVPSKVDPQIKADVQIKVENQSKTHTQDKFDALSKSEPQFKAESQIKTEMKVEPETPIKTESQDKMQVETTDKTQVMTETEVKIEVPVAMEIDKPIERLKDDFKEIITQNDISENSILNKEIIDKMDCSIAMEIPSDVHMTESDDTVKKDNISVATPIVVDLSIAPKSETKEEPMDT